MYSVYLLGGLLVISTLAGLYLTSSPPPMSTQIAQAMTWIASTPSGTRLLAVDDDAFNSVNSTMPGHFVIFDAGATGGPVIAGFIAATRGCEYLIVTDNIPAIFYDFNSTSLSGALLVFTTASIHIFKVTSK